MKNLLRDIHLLFFTDHKFLFLASTGIFAFIAVCLFIFYHLLSPEGML